MAAPAGDQVSGVAVADQAHSLRIATSGITADEVALYDRQIRLWGMDAQEKIRNARILLIGMRGVGNEIAKNLVLAGINSLTVMDDALAAPEDLAACFLINEEHVGKPRSQAVLPSLHSLNPRVNTTVAPFDRVMSEDDRKRPYVSQYNLVIATDLPITILNTLNITTHAARIPFYAAGSHGFYGFVFADLITHTFSFDREKSNVQTKPGTKETATRTVINVNERKNSSGKVTETVTKQEHYEPLLLANQAPLPQAYSSSRRRLRTVTPLLPCLRALWDFETMSNGLPPSLTTSQDLQTFTKLATQQAASLGLPHDHLKSDFLRSFLQNLYGEITPVTAFLGGVLAQDAINVLGGREQPIQNMMFFDGEESEGRIYALVPIISADSIPTPVNVDAPALSGTAAPAAPIAAAPAAPAAPAPPTDSSEAKTTGQDAQGGGGGVTDGTAPTGQPDAV